MNDTLYNKAKELIDNMTSDKLKQLLTAYGVDYTTEIEGESKWIEHTTTTRPVEGDAMVRVKMITGTELVRKASDLHWGFGTFIAEYYVVDEEISH